MQTKKPHENQQSRRQCPQEGSLNLTEGELLDYEHANMLREDYNAIFYRKISHIIDLEQLQQTQHNIEKQIQSLAPTEDISISIFEENPFLKTPPLLTTKEAAQYHSKVRTKVGLLRKKGEIDVIISRLNIQRKTYLQTISQLVNEWSQVVKQRFQQEECLELQEKLMSTAKKHNLSKVIDNFIDELHQIFIGNWLMLQLEQADLKDESLTKLKVGSGRSKKQIIANMTLYLQEFYSPTIFKEFTTLITSLTQHCEELHTISFQPLNRLQNELSVLFAETKQISSQLSSKQKALMDVKIDIQIISDQILGIEKRLWSSQQKLKVFVRKEAQLLLEEYHHQKVMQKSGDEGSGKEESMFQNESFNYFHNQLSNRYKSYMVDYLKTAQQIQNLQQLLEKNNQLLENHQECLQSYSHAPLSYRREGYKISQPAQLVESLSQSSEEECQREWNLPLQTHRDQHLNIIHQQEKTEKSDECSIRQTPTLSPNKQNKENKAHLSPTVNPNVKIKTRSERYLVKKHLSIGSSYTSNQSQERGQCREYQLRVTKKYLILQPLFKKKESVLSISEKVELERIKYYQSNPQRNTIKINYGNCTLMLTFITKNMDSFCNKLKKVGVSQEKSTEPTKQRPRR